VAQPQPRYVWSRNASDRRHRRTSHSRIAYVTSDTHSYIASHNIYQPANLSPLPNPSSLIFRAISVPTKLVIRMRFFLHNDHLTNIIMPITHVNVFYRPPLHDMTLSSSSLSDLVGPIVLSTHSHCCTIFPFSCSLLEASRSYMVYCSLAGVLLSLLLFVLL
jgi:hypothetical protein